MRESENKVRQRVYEAHLDQLLGRKQSADGYLSHAAKRLAEAEDNYSQSKTRVAEVDAEIQALRELASQDGVTLNG